MSVFLAMLPLGGCINASVTQSNGGGGQDTSSCIAINNPDDNSGTANVTNNCEVSVNFLEFSSGSQGLIEIAAMSSVQQTGVIFCLGRLRNAGDSAAG